MLCFPSVSLEFSKPALIQQSRWNRLLSFLICCCLSHPLSYPIMYQSNYLFRPQNLSACSPPHSVHACLYSRSSGSAYPTRNYWLLCRLQALSQLHQLTHLLVPRFNRLLQRRNRPLPDYSHYHGLSKHNHHRIVAYSHSLGCYCSDFTHKA